jgi:DNA-binding LacI/PurR family transcriptional regulator
VGVTAEPGRNRARAQAPTLEVVAARAGVSRATAGRVLAGATNVSEQAREAVLRAAREISYTPNLAARSLVTGRSDSVAFLVTESDERLFADPYFAPLLRGAHSVLAEAGQQLTFAIAGTDAEIGRFENYAAGGHVDGVLLISLHGDDRVPQALQSRGVPCVLSGRPLSGDPSLAYVDADNRGGAGEITALLLERGARHIATIAGPQDMCVGIDRLAGYRDALRAADVPVEPSRIVSADFTIAGGQAAMTSLLDRNPGIDAVFAASDHMAFGAMRALTAVGRRIPDDVMVAGFDDIDDAAHSTPPLTTMHQPVVRIGQLMAHTLLGLIEGRPVDTAQIVPVHLVRRRSA